jgi:hypothetical protein
MLSERGHPVGAEELIERIEAELAGDPLIVATKRREGLLMTKTEQETSTSPPGRWRAIGWAVAAFVVVVAVSVVFLALSTGGDRVADNPTTLNTTTTPTTAAPEAQAPTTLEVIEAGVAAFYSGDGDRAAELFELRDRTDAQIREEAAYQAAIGGRLTLSCIEAQLPSEYICQTPYANALTDAIGYNDSGDTNRVVVEDGVITSFGFPEHTFIVAQIGTFLAIEGRFEGYEPCLFGPFPESCATIQIENLDAWSSWRKTVQPADFAAFAVESWFGGDCVAARFVSNTDVDACANGDRASRAIEYESILEAEVSVDGCETLPPASSEQAYLTCAVHYSNAMSAAVGKPPSVTVKDLVVGLPYGVVVSAEGEFPWYEDRVYPDDPELRESFKSFAESGELAVDYAAAGCSDQRTPECATLIMDNLEAWAAWYQSNG